MMQLCSGLLWIVILWWTGTCIGAAVDAPNAGSPPPQPPPRDQEQATGLSKVKVVVGAATVALPASHVVVAVADEKKVEEAKEGKDAAVAAKTSINGLVSEEAKVVVNVGTSNPRQKRSLTPADTFTQGHRRYRRLPPRAWRAPAAADDEEEPSPNKSSFPESGSSSSSSLIYLVSSDIDTTDSRKEQNSFEAPMSDKKAFLSSSSEDSEDFPDEASFKSAADESRATVEEADGAMKAEDGELSSSRPLKRVDRSLTSDLFAAAGSSLAKNFMKRRRGGRMYDVPQIECPRSNDRMERFACPSPDFRGRFRCIDDRSLCDGFFDCPGREDENPDQCLFYKTTKAHLDILAEALLRWARGR